LNRLLRFLFDLYLWLLRRTGLTGWWLTNYGLLLLTSSSGCWCSSLLLRMDGLWYDFGLYLLLV
jgi:hypothetical protein